MDTRTSICFLRHPEPPDPYEAVFKLAGYRCKSIPVLEFNYKNLERLEASLNNPQAFEGLIITSPRVIPAFLQVSKPEYIMDQWRQKSVFVVGPRTAREVSKLGLSPVGEYAGSASKLAEIISTTRFSKPLLFVSGLLRSNDLPHALKSASIPYTEISAYETVIREQVPYREVAKFDWIVFFSPSGVDTFAKQGVSLWKEKQLACIGPSTARSLKAAIKKPEAVAASPTPSALLSAIEGL